MRSFAALLLSLAASAYAYTVTSPGGQVGWTDDGAQPVVWNRVDTDRLNFTIILVNDDTVMPNGPQTLAALVDGTMGNTTVNPPSAGWPTGSGFRVNFVQDANNTNTILAQSQKFTIKEATTTTSSTPKTTPKAGNTPTTSSGTTANDPNSTNTVPIGASIPGAQVMQVGLLSTIVGMLALLL